MTLIALDAGNDSLKFLKRRCHLYIEQGAFGVKYPVIPYRYPVHCPPAQAKGLTKQALRTVTFDGIANGFARGRDTESMMLQRVRLDKGSHQGTVVAFTMSINPAKFTGRTQM